MRQRLNRPPWNRHIRCTSKTRLIVHTSGQPNIATNSRLLPQWLLLFEPPTGGVVRQLAPADHDPRLDDEHPLANGILALLAESIVVFARKVFINGAGKFWIGIVNDLGFALQIDDLVTTFEVD